jgi:hypothetical protein
MRVTTIELGVAGGETVAAPFDPTLTRAPYAQQQENPDLSDIEELRRLSEAANEPEPLTYITT